MKNSQDINFARANNALAWISYDTANCSKYL